MPIAALYGHNVMERVPPGMCDWYKGGSLFETLDRIDKVWDGWVGHQRCGIWMGIRMYVCGWVGHQGVYVSEA